MQFLHGEILNKVTHLLALSKHFESRGDIHGIKVCIKWTIFGVQLTIVANSSLWQSGAALNCHKIQMAEHFSIAAIVAAIAAFHVL